MSDVACTFSSLCSPCLISVSLFLVLFIFGCAGSLLLFSGCGEQGLFSRCGDGLLLAGASRRGAQTPGCVGSVVAAPRLWSAGSGAGGWPP